MKKMLLTLTIASILLACGGKKSENMADNKGKDETKSEEQNNKENVENISENTSTNEPVSASEKRREERKKKGDTLAIAYSVLLKMLPDEVEGYKVSGEPEGTTMNLGNGSYSMATKTYVNGEKNIKIVLSDYNMAGEMYETMSAMWNISSESGGVKTESFKDPKNLVVGLETYDKNNKNATIMAGVGYRFVINLEANQQMSIDLVKKIFQKLPLDELSKK